VLRLEPARESVRLTAAAERGTLSKMKTGAGVRTPQTSVARHTSAATTSIEWPNLLEGVPL
jgi:hypothetical protein